MATAKSDKVTARIYYDTQEDGDLIYQYFRFVFVNFNHKKYFFDTNYKGYYILEDEMQKKYIGDGEKILFLDKKILFGTALIIITYKKNIENVNYKKSDQFLIEAPIPINDGCLYCEYFVKNNRICKYYNKIGIEIKNNCPDFRQK